MNLTKRLAVIGLGLAYGLAASADVMIDGQVISSTDITEITIDPTNGDIAITTTGGYTVTNDGGGGGGTPDPVPTINSFTASATNVTVGDTITTSWTTTDASSCVGVNGYGNWNGANLAVPNGTSAPILMDTAGTYTFRITCQNTGGTRSRSVSVVVEPETVTQDCSNVSLSGEVLSWNEVFGTSWPNPRYWEDIVTIPRSGYLAIEFNTGNVVEDGGWLTIKHTSTSGIRLGSISPCPGDFSNYLPDGANICTQAWGLSGSIQWSTEGAAAYANECSLQPNTTYYLNMTFTNGVSAGSTTCTGSPCRAYLRVWR